MKREAVDLEFSNAVRNAAAGNAESLAEMLRSDLPLGPGERSILADLISGKLAMSMGRPQKGIGNAQIVEVVERYRKLRLNTKEEVAALETAVSTGFSKSTIRRWYKDTIEREKLTAKYQNL